MKLSFTKKFIDKKKYQISISKVKDINKISIFINKFWKKDHIFFKSKKLLKFQHLKNNKLNWVLAKNKKTKKIEGILGLISKNFYSKGFISTNDDIWIAIIIVAQPLYPSKGLGTEMIKYFVNKFKPNSLSAIGINERVSKLYKKLGLKIDFLNHYYLKNTNKNIKYFVSQTYISEDFEEIKNFKSYDQRQKNYNYFFERFYKHPVYDYKLLVIKEKEIIKNFIVFRKIKYNKKSYLRVIDIGSIKNLYKFNKKHFLYLVKYFNAVYLDFLNFGLEKSLITKIGFKLKKNVIIPHHFEPFENRNIDIMISYKSKKKNFYVFKGDSDLDRPSR